MKNHYLIGISKSGKSIAAASQPNGHIGITGKSGSGKSYLMYNIIIQASVDMSCVIIDMGNSFSVEEMMPDVKKAINDKITVIDAAREKLPFNPFMYMTLQADINKNAASVSDMLKQCLNMGDQQKNELYIVIRDILEEYINDKSIDNMNLESIHNILINKKGRAAQGAAARLTNFAANIKFDKNTGDGLKKILYGKPKIYIFQLSSLPEELKSQTADFILYNVMAYAEHFGGIKNPFLLVLDEMQKFNSSKYAPITRIITEGRKYGINCMYATQFADYSSNKNMLSYIEQAATRIYLKPENTGINKIARFLGNDTDWKKIIKNMPCGDIKNKDSEKRYGIVYKSDNSEPEDMMVKIYTNEYIIRSVLI